MSDFSELQSGLSGSVIERGHPGFEDAVRGFNLYYSQSPDVVVTPATTADVVEAVRFAAAHALPVRVQATGHGAHHLITDGLLVDTRLLDEVSVDATAKTATFGAGARWASIVAAAASKNLAPITGSSANVGAVGYLLGGGLGPLVRSHGVSSDYVRSVTLVTADGELVLASADSNPELFWALRGGKGGFGVVTEMTIRLVDIPSLYAGSLTFDGAHLETVLTAWAEYVLTAHDDVSTSVGIVHLPDVEQIPEQLRGKTMVSVRFAFPGSVEQGERLAAPLRAIAPVLIDALGPMPLGDVAAIHADPTDPSPAWGRAVMLKGPGQPDLDSAFVAALLEQVGVGVPSPIMVAELRHLGSAAIRDVAGGSAVGGRSSNFTLMLVGAPNPALFELALPAAADAVAAAIAPWVSPEITINFAGGAGAAVFESAWPAETFARLAAVRASVDPTGLFPYGPHDIAG